MAWGLSRAAETGGTTRPRHVAVIMDGNGRWATDRGWPRLVGHRRGAERVKQIVRACPDLGVDWLTIYAFSTENWKRSTEEVLGLMKIFRRYIQNRIVQNTSMTATPRSTGSYGAPRIANGAVPTCRRIADVTKCSIVQLIT